MNERAGDGRCERAQRLATGHLVREIIAGDDVVASEMAHVT